MRRILSDEYVSYDDVMCQNEIFIVAANDGNFFMCFDYYAPKKAKLWYKFSINPFDIDFLKFKRVDYGIFNRDEFIINGLQIMFDYLHTCREDLTLKNANILSDVFFRGGKMTNSLNKIKELKWRKKSISKEDYYGRINRDRVYRVKSRLTNKTKDWLKRIYQEYNFMDNSIEYIKDYYVNWVVLVETIQNQKENMIEPIWKFIKRYNIHSFKEFYYNWKKVVDKEIHVRNVGYSDVVRFYDILRTIIQWVHLPLYQ